MIFTNHYYNTKPVIAHNPFCDLHKCDLWEMIYEKHFEFTPPPKDVTIVTWNNKIFQSFLQNQLEEKNIPYLCLGVGEDWTTNRLKPLTLLKEINQIKTKYILGLDCFDVMIVGDLHNIIDKFKKKQTSLLYNATGTVYPYRKIHSQIERIICPNPPFQFFNSGVFLGEADFIEYALKSINFNSHEHPHSDQYLIRQFYHQNHPKIQIDWKCDLFQVMYLQKEDIGKYVSLQTKLL